ncbi:MAG: transporter substrate-binding domain-containing protein [Pseudomonadaceae bacterium]|nr:transporter substrate-binding domain-containing protein [Pseudomonadaceae bacterium]
MGNCIRFCWVLLLLSGTAQVTADEPLTYLTEAYPPYNFSDNNILRGIAVDLLVLASQQTEQPVQRSQIRLMPWARSYRTVLKTANSVLFSTARTPAREKLFKWAGPIASNRVVLLAKKSRGIHIDFVTDLQHYRIGSIRDDVAEQLVRDLGVQENQLNLAANADALAKQLQAGRIDLWAYDENVAHWFMRNAGIDPDDFESVYVLQEGELWYAFNPQVSDKQVQQLQKAIEQIRQTPGISGKTRYDDILIDYL